METVVSSTREELATIFEAATLCLSVASEEQAHKALTFAQKVVPFHAASIYLFKVVGKQPALVCRSIQFGKSTLLRAINPEHLGQTIALLQQKCEAQKNGLRYEEPYLSCIVTHNVCQTVIHDTEQCLSGFVRASRTKESSSLCTLMLLSVGRSQDVGSVGGRVRALLPHLHEAMSRIADEEVARTTPSDLTEREIEVLRWAKEGKTGWEIGRILSISERTVKFHLNNAFSKLKVVNRTQAVAKAFQERIFQQ